MSPAEWERDRIAQDFRERGASQRAEDARTTEGPWAVPLDAEARAAICAHLGLDVGGEEAETLGDEEAVRVACEAACDGYEAAARDAAARGAL